MEQYEIFITGLVQGIGFRPYIYRLAKRLGITGVVFNNMGSVKIEAEGELETLQTFYTSIPKEIPVKGYISSIHFNLKKPFGYKDFTILESINDSADNLTMPPDFSICEACKKEILDKTNRRYFYPFTTCTDCGPRLTIINKFPYDRLNTVMSDFPLCKSCEMEYNNPENRRFHAELIACPECGPNVTIYESTSKTNVGFSGYEKLFNFLKSSLQSGEILAIKSIGGFHLACEATNVSALQTLRLRKNRKRKPFAVMFPDIESISKIAFVSEKEKELLVSAGSPIVLLRKKNTSIFPEEVDGFSPFIGAFLPYTPIHVLLFEQYFTPLVMTSANNSDNPVIVDNEEAILALQSIADYIILHNRPILLPSDDSVMKITNGRKEFIRRGRGFSPFQFKSLHQLNPILSLGADNKNTISFTYKNNIITSQHVGKLNSPNSLKSYANTITHYTSLYHLTPKSIVSDKHPEYYSTKMAKGLLQICHPELHRTELVERVEGQFTTSQKVKLAANYDSIQHHHAHIASCMAENNYEDPIVGIAMDGTGYGPHNSIWGGEFLVCDRNDFIRSGHFLPLLLPGGEIAIKEVWRLGLSALLESGVSKEKFNSLEFLKNYSHWEKIQFLWERKLNSTSSTSCGRLFDAVSAIIDICTIADYDGEPAIQLENQIYKENLEKQTIVDFYKFEIIEGKTFTLNWRNMITEIVLDIQSGISKGKISLKFHLGLVHAMAECGIRISEKFKINTIALSGGCFHNSFLKEKLIYLLEKNGKNVIYHSELPSGDGGISFGQIIVANSILLGEKSCVLQYR